MSESSVYNPYSDISAELLSTLITNLSISENISNNTTNLNTMALPHFDVKTLCILPNFDGNPSELYDFIKVATTLLNHYFDRNPANENCIQNILLLQGIASKIIGKAKEIISIYGYNNWNELKTILIENFGDQRNENSLTRDLVNLRQNFNEQPQQFYHRCLEILNTICNYIEIHNNEPQIIQNKKQTGFNYFSSRS